MDPIQARIINMSGKHLENVRIKKEPMQESQFVEADSSSNSTSSNAAEAVTRQSSLQRIQLRKDRVMYLGQVFSHSNFIFLQKFVFNTLKQGDDKQSISFNNQFTHLNFFLFK